MLTPGDFVCKYIQASFVWKALTASGTTTELSWSVAGNKPPSILWPSSCAYWLCSLQGKNPQFYNYNTYHVSKIQPASKWTGLISQCFRKIVRYWWSDVLNNTPLLIHNWEFSMGPLSGPIGNQVFSIMFFLSFKGSSHCKHYSLFNNYKPKLNKIQEQSKMLDYIDAVEA